MPRHVPAEPNVAAVRAMVANAKPVAVKPRPVADAAEPRPDDKPAAKSPAKKFNDPEHLKKPARERDTAMRRAAIDQSAQDSAREGIPAGKWRESGEKLPPDCPVRPLGVSGRDVWLIDPIGQVQLVKAPYGKGELLGLFAGDADYLTWAWPRWSKDGMLDGYKAEQAAADLVNACFRCGPWNAADKIRGRGAWRGADGEIIYHAGTKLHIKGEIVHPCDLGGYVYPTRPSIAGPWPHPVEADKNPSALILGKLRSWNWARPEVDPVLLLGWIGAASIAGALPWRPAAFITGDKATGKSTLQGLIKGLFCDGLIQAADTTAAGIYQHVGQDCLPVSVDELEGEADVRKQKAVLKLARLAASGALMLRGGDRHEGVEFQARSAFIFSSINTPPLEPQDLSRMAILRLYRLAAGQDAPCLEPQELAVAGQHILRRMIDEWPRFGETYAAFRRAMADAGMDGRGQDTFGTLLTCADMIGHQGWDEERLRTPTADGDLVAWSDLMAIDKMHEFEDAAENWRLCLSHMLSVPVEAWRNGTRTAVGQVLYDYYHSVDDMNAGTAKLLLSKAGLTLVKRGNALRENWLAIPNQNAQTRALFDGSKWAGDVGAGVWAGALRQAPFGAIYDTGLCLINGTRFRATLINLDGLYGETGIMADEAVSS